jgi:hypothetical protein
VEREESSPVDRPLLLSLLAGGWEAATHVHMPRWSARVMPQHFSGVTLMPSHSSCTCIFDDDDNDDDDILHSLHPTHKLQP